MGAFHKVLCSEGLRDFRGAVVVCFADGTQLAPSICTESWAMVGGCVRQETYLEVVENALDADSGAGDLLEEVLAIDGFDLPGWIEKARAQECTVTLFARAGPSGASSPGRGAGRLRACLIHHMIPSRAEFHVRFVVVPRSHRGNGLGQQVMRWVLAQAANMPQSMCRWITLNAASDDLVPWYERFGFLDMSCGHEPDDLGQ